MYHQASFAASTDNFQYESLPTPTSIRLIKVLSPANPPDSLQVEPNGAPIPHLIQCSVETIDLAERDRPNYYALSYTWGIPFPETWPTPSQTNDRATDYDPNNKLPILLNGKVIFVTKNLYEFLRRAEESASNSGCQEPSGCMVWPGDDIERRIAPYNKTPLIRAAEKGYYDYVSDLIQRDADVNAQDRFGHTSLHYAAENGHLSVTKLLLRAGGDPTIKDTSGSTPLDTAEQVSQHRGFDREAICRALCGSGKDEAESSSTDEASLFKHHLWIDAMSINQNDVPERNAQVTLMKRIYEEAAGSIIWLGPEDEHTKMAKHTTTLICREAGDWWLSMALNLDDGHESRYSDPDVESKQFAALNGLLRRTWFKRIWVIQEIARAKELHVFCGKYRFPWEVLFEYVHYNCSPTALRQLKRTRRFQPVKPLSLNNDIVTDQIFTIRLITRADTWERNCIQLHGREMGKSIIRSLPEREHLTLGNLLVMVWRFKATEPRDRIFALQGLLAHTAEITVDYERSISEIYTTAAHLLMEGSKGPIAVPPLFGLTLVEPTRILRPKDSFYLPSWVPDFNMYNPTVAFLRNHYAAGTALPFQLDTGVRKDTLHLQGIRFDVIDLCEERDRNVEEKVAHFFQPKPEASHVHEEFLYPRPLFCPRSFFGIGLSLSPSYPGGGTRVEALWRTATNDSIGRDYSGVSDTYDTAKNSFRDFVRFLVRDRAPRDVVLRNMICQLAADDASNSLPASDEFIQDGIPPEQRRYHDVSDALPWDTIWQQTNYNVAIDLLLWSPALVNHPQGEVFFNDAMYKYYRWRRLYKTSTGYLGLGPRSVRPGDEIWLIAGAQTPFVLRRVNSNISQDGRKFELVGETYVHGIMEGEAAKGRENDVEDITLI
ncbi:hypothetical protein NA57DRAFT_70266 [Rhizodiscina lignyota]|uniref:Heterokaryon incompatibility domain-containing protein n=1 Tax=Rhizodiscina lignyota TaxID=1504668 RepID=A0A9P4IMW3_9PEZI|nr:hypothetical protein NA57DRAFT_70266 [Rhizodiscina lignyota]